MAEPRRQARGLARIEQIIDAAGEEIVAVGYDNATMNAIARRAGISPGSLYQFFPDKPALVGELLARFRAMFEASLPADPSPELVRSASLAALIDGAVDPLLDFAVAHPGFQTLFLGLDEHGPVAGEVGLIHDSLHTRLSSLIRLRVPSIGEQDAARMAELCHAVVKGAVPTIAITAEPERSRFVAELKTMLLRYLEPYDRG